MNPRFSWLQSPDQIRIWADLVLVWTVATYCRRDNTINITTQKPTTAHNDGPGRDFTIGLLAAIFTTFWASRSGMVLGLSGVMFVLVLVPPLLRRWLTLTGRIECLPLFELAVPASVSLLLGNLIGAKTLQVIPEFVDWPAQFSTRVSLPLSAAAILFVGRGGTHFVKAVCATGKILPKIHSEGNQMSDSMQIDPARLGMGRKLGAFERILMLILVVSGRYEALGFVFAAKGLIRSKEFEDRDFTEYFLLGSMASILISILAGEVLLRVIPQ